MKNLFNKYLGLLISLLSIQLLSSCIATQDFDLEVDNNPPIVIHAVITDQAGPYYVQVSRAISDFDNGVTNVVTNTHYTPITNATVMLSDDQGNNDVLTPYNQIFPEQNDQGEVLTFAQYGFYRTSTNIQGVPGRTYTLTVQHEGKTYEAKATMPQPPPAITINYNQLIYPLLNFSEPQTQDDYYMFFYRDFSGNDPTSSEAIENQFEDNLWPLFYQQLLVYSDHFWDSEVKDLDIYLPNYEQGAPVFFCSPPNCPENIQVQMHAISKEAYEFYNALNQQTGNDGGTFHSEPATPPTNFTNGAFGIFRASSVRSIIAPIRY